MQQQATDNRQYQHEQATHAALERLEALEGSDRKNRCPDCDCPNRYCACVLMERVRGAEAERRKAVSDAATYRSLFQCAASLIAHNRDRLRRPRGEDEARVLAYLDESGAPGLGPFWSGKTNGWIKPDMIAAARTSESTGDSTAAALERLEKLEAVVRELLELAATDAWYGSFRLDDALQDARDLIATPAPAGTREVIRTAREMKTPTVSPGQ